MVRRTLLQAHRRIADVLAVRDRPDLTPEESDAAIDALRREIATVWQTEEVRDRAVSPLDEVRGGLAVFEQTLWEALPRYTAADRSRARRAAAARRRAAALRIVDRRRPRRQPERDAGDHAAGGVDGAMGGRRPVRARDRRAARGAVDRRRRPTSCVRSSATRDEPYRALLRDVAARLRRDPRLRGRQDRARRSATPTSPASLPDGRRARGAAAACHRSLVATGNALIAAGRLTDILRRVAAFGLVAGAARPAAGSGPPHRGGRLDRAASGTSARTKTPRKRSASRC